MFSGRLQSNSIGRCLHSATLILLVMFTSACQEPHTDSFETSRLTSEDLARFPGSRLYRATSSQQQIAVILLHGSEGGDERHIDEYARHLASTGLNALVYCYFGCAGTPQRLENVDIGKVVAAAAWLESAEGVSATAVGLFGWSRGAELTLNLASLTEETTTFAAVAAMAPLDYVVGGFDNVSQQSLASPAWVYEGQPLISKVFEHLDAKIAASQSGSAPSSYDYGQYDFYDYGTYDSYASDDYSPYGYDDYYYDDYFYDDEKPSAYGYGDYGPWIDDQQVSFDEAPASDDGSFFCLEPGQTAEMNLGSNPDELLQPGVWGTAGMIPVERYRGPMLLAHGRKDSLWPYEASVRLQAVRQKVAQYATELHLYDDCHAFSQANDADLLGKLVDFFTSHLRP